MAYKTKFLHFKTKASYEAERAKTTEGSEERKVFDAYISFIDEGPTICTWGKEYQCDANSLSLLPQEVTTEKQDQVFKNLGWKVHVISQSDINATTSPDAAEKTKRLEATALLVKETSLIYVRGNDDSSNHYFFKINSSSQLELIRISITTGIIYGINSQFVDTGTIRYDRTQTLSDSNKTLARENIDAANKNDVLPLTIDLNSQTVEDYNTALEAFNSKKPLTIFDSTDPTSRFTANVIEKEATTNNINIYFSFTGISDANTLNTIGYVGTIKPTGEKTSSFAAIVPSNMDPKPLGQASPGTDNAYSRSDHVHPAQVDITGNAATATTATTATNLATKPILSRNENYIQVTVGNKISDNFTVPYASKTSAAETLMYGRKIFLNGDVTGSTTESFDGSKNVTINTTISTINAEKLTGTIDANRLPEIPIEKIPAASATQSGVVTTGDQSFAGEKIFRGGILAQDADISDLIIGSSLEFNAFGRFNYIATSTEAGGIKIGATASGVNLPLVLNSSNQAYIAVTKGAVTAALGFTPANVNDIPKIPIALPNPYALTINGTSYTGSSAVSISTSKPLSVRMLTSSTVNAGYSYSCGTSKAISTLNGFSSTNPNSVIISSAKLTFTASNVIKMDGLDDLSGTWYIYCLSYMANSKIAVNGAVYA